MPLDKTVVEKDGERPTINTQQALTGAELAIEAMTQWWADLLDQIRAASKTQDFATA